MLRPLIASMLAVSAAHAASAQADHPRAALPLSGAESKSGSRLRDGYQLAVELANQQGGVEVGGERRPVKLILVGRQERWPTDERAVEELVWQGVDVMLGTFGSSLVEKGSAVSERLEDARDVRCWAPGPAARSISAGSSTCSGCRRPSSRARQRADAVGERRCSPSRPRNQPLAISARWAPAAEHVLNPR